MNAIRINLGLVLATLLILAAAAPAAADDELSARHRRWLREEVIYIITAEEREAFGQLDSNELRDRFIETFWERRDPTPGTFRNEFREEHSRRIEYANMHFGPRSRSTGWRTERGRIYIMLGEPKERQQFPNNATIYPCELWFYSADSRLPGISFFYIIFYRRGGASDYEVYHPQIDGPEALSVYGSIGHSRDQILQELSIIHFELAQAAVSLNPMDPAGTLASEVLLGHVDNYPEYAVDGSWATTFVEMRGQVDVTYTFRPVEVRALAHVFSPPAGGQQLHFAFMLMPEDIDIGLYEDEYFGAFEIIPSLDDTAGTTIFQDSINAEIAWSREEFSEHRSRPLMFADIVPIIPGDYNLTVSVRNKFSRTYFIFTLAVQVPEPGPDTFQLSELLINNGYERGENDSATATFASPFRFFNIQYSPSATNEFASSDNVHVFCELYYPPGAGAQAALGDLVFDFDIYRDDQLLKRLTHIIPQARVNPMGIVYMSRQLLIDDLERGSYRLEVTARAERGGQSTSRTALFSIRAPEEIPRPSMLPLHERLDMGSSEMRFVRGQEFLAAGHSEMAIETFREVLQQDPQHVGAAMELARALIDSGLFEEAFTTLREVERNDPNNRQLVLLLAEACVGREELSLAIGYMERLLFINANDVEVLNRAGGLYRLTNQLERARERWQRSLTINPDQPEIQRELESLEPQ